MISELRAKAMEFIDNNGDGSCEYCDGYNISTSSDNPDKAVVSLQNDRGTSYGMYVKVQNELVAAYEDLRERYAQEKYGRSYRTMDDEADADILKEIKLLSSRFQRLNLKYWWIMAVIKKKKEKSILRSIRRFRILYHAAVLLHGCHSNA